MYIYIHSQVVGSLDLLTYEIAQFFYSNIRTYVRDCVYVYKIINVLWEILRMCLNLLYYTVDIRT